MCIRLVSTIILLIGCFNLSTTVDETKVTMSTVVNWAENIGMELWIIAQEVTKLQNINKRYGEMDASVEKTDGKEILETIANRMNKLVKEKVDAVLRIKNAAMQAERHTKIFNDSNERFSVPYRSSKFSTVTIPPEVGLKMKLDIDQTPSDDAAYTPMVLVRDPHFKDVLVNTNYSAVHVPTNIFDRWDSVITPISWSEAIDDTFKSNYKTDPSLMWQYYASTSGFLRHYPAFHWALEPDRYDCRRRIWYVQAATCSKEVVVLIDNSGTMYGMRNTIAQLTVDYLLQTFSNNDYISIFRLFEENVTGLVKCFENTLIQATPENIELFRSALYRMCPEKKINYSVGFQKAFDILHGFMKNKTEKTEKRNQAVFLLTDTMPPPAQLKIIRDYYDLLYNDTEIQVELFIYFIGKDIPDIREIQWEKCLRNGSIVHVRTMDEAPEDALKYLSIMARTQNESTKYYPVSWTHTFFDIKRTGYQEETKVNDTNEIDGSTEREGAEDDDTEYGNVNELRIMTSVTTPVYASKTSGTSGPGRSSNVKKEEMIGVAAIDVPILDFKRLTMAHKIGVNGYAFVVTNNGYVLFHPNLRPVVIKLSKNYLKKIILSGNDPDYLEIDNRLTSEMIVDKKVRENFNSVDLSELEFYDDNSEQPRTVQQQILTLREQMVNQEEGYISGLPIKFNYHDQKRVGTEYRSYYFKPLKCSPFSVGLALPQGYGNYWVKTTQEIEKTKLMNDDYLRYFQGNWTIHPDWTYCDFRNNTKFDLRFQNRTEKLIYFLGMIFKSKDFVWTEEHNISYHTTVQNLTDAEFCFGEKETEKTDLNMTTYFCDKELMELLFFDAKLTAPEFEESDKFDDVTILGREENLKKIRILEVLNIIKTKNAVNFNTDTNHRSNMYTSLITHRTGNYTETFMVENKIRLKFVATQGGLTRWKNFMPEESGLSFGERNGTALDEVWYKSAVLLHEPDSENLIVLSIPQQYGNSQKKYITASYAVFYEAGGQEAPGVVVGFQFDYETLKKIVEENIDLCTKEGSDWDCYIIDASGYIIYSRKDHEIGKFYGTINGGGALMVDMVEKGLYRNISMFDYQGLKDLEIMDPFTVGASPSLTNPFNFIVWSMNWILSNVVWLLIESNLWQFINAGSSCSSVTSLKNTTTCQTCKQENKTCPLCCKAPKRYEDTCQTREVLPQLETPGSGIKKPQQIPVDRRFFLYLYTNLSKDGYSSITSSDQHTDCTRPYFLKRIKHTNLNLLLVHGSHSTCYVDVNVEPIDIDYSQTEDGKIPACNKIMMNSYPRKKLLGCSDKLPEAKTRDECGSGHRTELQIFLILAAFFTGFII